MKATKTLLATSVVSALAAIGSADAATIATFNITNTGNITAPVTGHVNETGTAFLDDGSGSGVAVLTMNKSGRTDNTSSGSQTYTSQNIYYGTIAGSIFHVTSGTVENLACLASNTAQDGVSGTDTGTTGCSANLLLGTVQALGPSVAGTVTGTTGQPGGLPLTDLNFLTGGNLKSVTRGLAVTVTTMAFTVTTPPSIPVPAAAWLFGSGLLGLAGTARRRRTAVVAA